MSLSISFVCYQKVYDQANKMTKQQIEYLIQDAKQQMIRSSYPDNEIVIHIIIHKLPGLDQIDFKSIPTDITCKKLIY